MADVDDRVVAIHFDNRAFERNIATTLDSLEKLRQGLEFNNASTGLNQLAESVDGFNFAGMGDAIDNISNKFSAMGAIAFSVIQDITQSALASARETANMLIEPLLGGGKTRATNIENAKFQFRGLGIDVQKAMDSALAAVKGTAFGLDEAAKAAAQFGASGIDAGKEMTTALRGIAGSAAMTNTSFAEIADIFTSVAGIGTLSNQDLNRFAVRGLNAAATLAKQFNVTEAEVKEMARNGEISFDEFSKAMDKAFGEHATKANETYTGSLANMRAAMARIGASFFGPQMEQQKNLFNALTPVIDNVNTALQPFISALLEIRGVGVNNLISILKNLDLSSLTASIPNFAKSLLNVFYEFKRVLDIVKFAFRNVFPESQTSILIKLSEAVLRFTERLVMGGETVDKMTRIFLALFDTLAIGWEFIKIVGGLLKDLFSTISGASGLGEGGVLDFFVNLAEKIIALKWELVNYGGMKRGIESFVETIRDFFEGVVEGVQTAIQAVKDFFGIADDIRKSVENNGFAGAEIGAGRLGERLKWLGLLAAPFVAAWNYISDNMQSIGEGIGKAVELIGEAFKGIGGAIADSMSTGNFDEVFDIINTGLLGGILFAIRKFINGGLGQLGAGFLDKINDIMDGLTETLGAMQAKLKSEALMKIATAIGILAASLLVLSLIDSEALTKALLAMASGFGLLVGTLALLDKLSLTGAKLGGLAIAMVGLATAMLVLSTAVAILSTLDWEELSKGLVGVAALLGAVTLAVNFMPDQGGMIRAGIGITAMAVGIRILANAVQAMATLSWGEMAKGLTGVAIGLGVLVLAMRLMPNGAMMIAAGAGILLVSIGLNILAGAVKLFSLMDFGEIAKGIGAIAASLIVIAGAMHLMPLSLPITGAGLILVGIGLNAIATALKIFGSMDLGEMVIGLGAMAATLGILAIATMAMNGTIAGSAAIMVSAVAMGILATVIGKFGSMPIGDILKGLIGMAAALAVLGVAATLITPTIPSLLGLGIALTLVGAGFALFGIGAAAVANALKLIADTGKVAAEILTMIFKALVDEIPGFAVAIAEGIVRIVGTVLESLPSILEDFGLVITALLELIVEKVPEFIDAGFEMLMALLKGVRDNIGEIVIVVAEIITEFLDALAAKVPEIVDSVFNLVLTIIESLVLKMAEVHLWLVPFGFRLLMGLLDGMFGFVPELIGWFGGLAGKVIEWIGDVGSALFEKGKDFIKGLYKGLVDRLDGVKDWFLGMKDKVKRWLANAGKWLIEAGKDVIRGLWEGIQDMKDWLGDKMETVGGWVKDPLGSVLDMLSPSRVMMGMGRDVVRGLGIGIEQMGSQLQRTSAGMGEDILSGFSVDMRRVSAYGEGVVDSLNRSLTGLNLAALEIQDINPTITPVVDLSNVQRSANEISAMMASNTIVATSSFDKAAAIALDTNRQNGSETQEPQPPEVREIKFEQVINSPVELSVSDIYRNTRTQFAMAKEELQVL